MEPILEVHGLCKHYPSFDLENVSFSLSPGEITGFIGRNGAGKTTAIKAIAGLLSKDSGSILYQGKPIEEEEKRVKNEISLLFGGIDFFPTQKVKTLSKVTKRFYENWDESLYQKWLRFFSIDENKRIKELSNGMKVKYNLAIALSHNAKLLLLDEPTSGLDPVSRDELLDSLREIAKKKETAILFSTHVISDLEKCADKIVYIKKGRILSFKDVPSFKKDYLHIEGKEESINPLNERAILHERKKGDGKFEGVILAKDAHLFEGAMARVPSLEEIMIAEERGNENEESPL